MNYYSFKDDPNTQTDDYLAKAAAVNDRISTVAGAMVSIVGVLSPIAIILSPSVENNVKLASLGGGLITGGAGAFLGRQQPKSLEEMAKDRLQQHSQSSREGEF
ncbi:hypothetical protein [Pleurocapsa sp. PCC 7319]|uniref:hypothetical protein n=1 Tax=Pleurocapsa sp. PCC 7319 TaxID=118161 RepID=UPI000347B1DE|nr:hypothetical protein [Pleurocapsa sp. PCC 7319]